MEVIEKTKKTGGQKTLYILKAIAGVILAAIIITAFFIDRVILILLPHIHGETMGAMFRRPRNTAPMFYRVAALFVGCVLLKVIKSAFY